MTTELEQRWQEIMDAGGPEQFVRQELKRMGVYRSFKPNLMTLTTESEKTRVIEAARRENAARSETRQYVQEARKATHIVHLGPDIFWNDFLKDDHFDPFAAETRLQDRELPIMTSVEDVLTFLREVVPDLTIPMLRSSCTHRQMSQALSLPIVWYTKKKDWWYTEDLGSIATLESHAEAHSNSDC